MEVVVAKYGGTSLATTEHIAVVADGLLRDLADGARRVVVVSAMGDTTDDLLALAGRVTQSPEPRELDLLLATGEQISAALLVMALQARGVDAVSLTGPQAGTTACHNSLAMRIAGLTDPILYVGSYSDWSRSAMPVVTGTEPGRPEDAHR